MAGKMKLQAASQGARRNLVTVVLAAAWLYLCVLRRVNWEDRLKSQGALWSFRHRKHICSTRATGPVTQCSLNLPLKLHGWNFPRKTCKLQSQCFPTISTLNCSFAQYSFTKDNFSDLKLFVSMAKQVDSSTAHLGFLKWTGKSRMVREAKTIAGNLWLFSRDVHFFIKNFLKLCVVNVICPGNHLFICSLWQNCHLLQGCLGVLFLVHHALTVLMADTADTSEQKDSFAKTLRALALRSPWSFLQL